MMVMNRLLVVVPLSLAACIGVYRDPPPPGGSAHEVTGTRIVFVTSTEYQGGELGGLAGADAKCASRAVAAGLPGTYRAWLSDAATSARDRLTHATGAYELVDGTPVTSGWDALVAYGVDHPIDRDELGRVHAQSSPSSCDLTEIAPVWTGTALDGTYAGDNTTCDGWNILQRSDGFVPNALAGNSTNGGSHWTDTRCSPTCSGELAALYCVEQ
jgi:hypothetical protein